MTIWIISFMTFPISLPLFVPSTRYLASGMIIGVRATVSSFTILLRPPTFLLFPPHRPYHLSDVSIWDIVVLHSNQLIPLLGHVFSLLFRFLPGPPPSTTDLFPEFSTKGFYVCFMAIQERNQ